MTKMTDAFKKVFLGLGGDPKELAENNDVGDYIVDLEDAIKDYVGDKTEDLIDDTEASSTKTYSSSKVESLIPDLPEDEIVVINATASGTPQIVTIEDPKVPTANDLMSLVASQHKMCYLRVTSSDGMNSYINMYNFVQYVHGMFRDTVTFRTVKTNASSVIVRSVTFDDYLTSPYEDKTINL